MTVGTDYQPHSYHPGAAMAAEPIPFTFLDAADLVVTHVDGVTGVPTQLFGASFVIAGATIRATTAWPADDLFVVERRTARRQPASLPAHEPIPSKAVERQLDRMVLVAQEGGADHDLLTARALRSAAGEAGLVLAPALLSRVPYRFVGRNPATGAIEERDLDQAFKGDPGGNAMAIGLFTAAAALNIPNGTDLVQTSGWGAVGRGIARYVYDATVDAAYVLAHPRSSFRSLNGRGFRLAEPRPNVLQLGAIGDGAANDSPAFDAGVAIAKVLEVPPGTFRLADPVALYDGQTIVGAGKSGWEPYTGGNFPNVHRTRILVDGTMALDARGTNSVTVRGICFMAVEGHQSVYREAPGYQAGAVGIDITASSQFEASDVAFMGLAAGVQSHRGAVTGETQSPQAGVETDDALDLGAPTQMPRISDWMASDCYRVFHFGKTTSAAYTVRDGLIGDCMVALHCGKIVEAHVCDGIRINNARLYQCTQHSVHLRGCDFVEIVGTTLFETGLEGLFLDGCKYVNASLKVARSGFYVFPGGTEEAPIYQQRAAIKLVGCEDVAIAGAIERPTGELATIDGCNSVTLTLAATTPFWITGLFFTTGGAIKITNSDAVTVNGSVAGENHWVSVWSDEHSAATLAGAITSSRSIGVVRAVKLQQQGGFVHRTAAAVGPIGDNGVAAFHTARFRVPAGKVLRTVCVEIDAPGVHLRTMVGGDGVFWSATAAAFGGGTISLERKALYSNVGGPDGYFDVELSFRNTSGAPVTVPAGTEVRISTVLA